MSPVSPGSAPLPQPSQRTQSDRQAILTALARVKRRLRLNRAAAVPALVVALMLLGLLVGRLLRIFGGQMPVLSAAAILAGLVAGTALLAWLRRVVTASRVSLEQAARVADERGALRNELASALDFLQAVPQAPAGASDTERAWIALQVARAARTARGVEPTRLVPLRLPRAAATVVAAAVAAVGIAWAIPPFTTPSSADALTAGALTEAQRAQLRALRELAAQRPESEAARRLSEALARLERKDIGAAEREQALQEAQEALEQGKLQAASAREGLYRLAQKLRGQKGMEAVAEALAAGRADQAADLLKQRHGGELGEAAREAELDAAALANERELDRLLAQAGQGGTPEEREISSAAMKEAVDRLNQIAQQLDVQGQLSESAPALQQMQLAVAQRSALSAGRFGQEAAPEGTPSPQAGQTAMRGGTMYRSAAVAQETKRSQQQAGSKAGDALGESQADPLLGAAGERLEVQLKREAAPGEGSGGEEKSEAWYYAQSKQQDALTAFREIPGRARFAHAESAPPEGVPIQHREIVKEYFMTLREGAR